jgi:P4 family phage/plasmid primase-like protien
LHNIDYRLLDCWLHFSIQTTRFSEEQVHADCTKAWSVMKTKAGGIHLGSLIKWAKDDNTHNTNFQTFMKISLESIIVECCRKFMFYKTDEKTGKESLKSTPWPNITYYVTKVLHKRWKYQLVCSSPTKRIWWEFVNHRWKSCELGLKKYLNEEAYNLFFTMSQKYHIKYTELLQPAVASDEDEVASNKKYYNLLHMGCQKLAENMRHAINKETTAKEADVQFYWQDSQNTDIIHRNNFEEILDSRRNLLGFENGVYDFDTHAFREGQCEDYVLSSTKNNYVVFAWDDPLIEAIMAFVSQVLPDPGTRDFVLKTFASFMEGNPAEKFHIFVGSGGNGKSKLVELFQHTMGEYCMSLPVTTVTAKRPDSNACSPEIARLKSARFVAIQEPNDKEVLQPGRLKELTGGDKIYARALNKDGFEFKPQFNMLMCCNSLPSVPSNDNGCWRRLCVVLFGSRFVSNPDPSDPNQFPIDESLTKKLETWGEGFAWILTENYKELMQKDNGHIVMPPAVLLETQKYREENDKLAQFIREKVDVTTKNMKRSLFLDELHEKYREWGAKHYNKGTKLVDRSELKTYMENNGYGNLTPIGEKKELGWIGIFLK